MRVSDLNFLAITVFVCLGVISSCVNGKRSKVKHEAQDVCDADSGCGNSASDNAELARELERVEREYLKQPLTADQKKRPALVHKIVTEFINVPSLEGYRSDVGHMGSSYEYTSIPGKSDYDVQFFIKLPQPKQNGVKMHSTVAQECDDPAWREVKGGPLIFLDSNGYLSADKARRLIQSEADRYLHLKNHRLIFDGDEARITRSTSGPATTLNVTWRGERLSIDIVVCLKAEDVAKSGDLDLVGKPYSRQNPKEKATYWRLSYSRKELDKLRDYPEEKRTLLRIMKVIKHNQPQLKYLPSYFYKNILFKLDEDMAGAKWDGDNLAKRFKDMIRIMVEVLDSGTLYLHFNKKVNYLVNQDANKLKGIVSYLKKIIEKNKYSELVRTV